MTGNQGSVRRGRRWHVTWVVAALLIALLAAPLATAAPEVQTTTTLRIGYLGPSDSPTANGAKLAIDQINGIGGVAGPDVTYQLELVTLDAYPSVATLPDAVDQLIAGGATVLLGPDTNALITPDTIQVLVDTGLPTLTAATGDALTEIDTSNHIFRIRAPERIYSYAMADYLTSDLGISQIVVVQTDAEFTEAASEFESILANKGFSLTGKVVMPGGNQLPNEITRIVGLNPQAVMMWGGAGEAAQVLAGLRDAGWTGTFAYRNAAEAARQGAIPRARVEGVLGVDSWTYGADTEATHIFLREYVVAYGEVPTSLSVAAYDAIWFLRAALRVQGGQPAALRQGLEESGPLTLVQGTFHPTDFGNGDLARLAQVYVLGKYGAPEVVAIYDDVTRLTPSGAPIPPTPTPTIPAQPTQPPQPTATLEGVWIQVKVNTLNVRSAPSLEAPQVAQIKLGDRFRVLGTLADRSWYVIDFSGTQAWVKAEFVDILGDINTVPIVAPPVTPTPAATPTITPPPFPDIVVDTVVLTPAQPVIGQPFIATVTVRNAGGVATGSFAVAATWEPGSVYTATQVQGLAAGQAVQVQLSGTLSGSPGVYQTAVVSDLNKEVAEINEDNNNYTVTYQVNQ